jgi:3-oxoacyl-[acyl-carrier-protein] synthase III
MVDRLRPTPKEMLPVGEGVAYYPKEFLGNPEVGLGGVHAGWGKVLTNEQLPDYISGIIGRELEPGEILQLDGMGFESRYRTDYLDRRMQERAEWELGIRMLKTALKKNGWSTSEIGFLAVGMSSPVCEDVTVRLAREVGIPEEATKITVHKACDSTGHALNLLLDEKNGFYGKKGLLFGLEGLSRGLSERDGVGQTRDVQAHQLFANGAGIIGLVPGVTLLPISVRSEDLGDPKGALRASVDYRMPPEGKEVEVRIDEKNNHIVVAGRIAKPTNGEGIHMYSNKGMLGQFGIGTADLIAPVTEETRKRLEFNGDANGMYDWIVQHHPNYKILLSQSKRLLRGHGISLRMDEHWKIHNYGNVSAASLVIDMLETSGDMRPGTVGLIVAYGAGAHYDVMSVMRPR